MICARMLSYESSYFCNGAEEWRNIIQMISEIIAMFTPFKIENIPVQTRFCSTYAVWQQSLRGPKMSIKVEVD